MQMIVLGSTKHATPKYGLRRGPSKGLIKTMYCSTLRPKLASVSHSKSQPLCIYCYYKTTYSVSKLSNCRPSLYDHAYGFFATLQLCCFASVARCRIYVTVCDSRLQCRSSLCQILPIKYICFVTQPMWCYLRAVSRQLLGQTVSCSFTLVFSSELHRWSIDHQ